EVPAFDKAVRTSSPCVRGVPLGPIRGMSTGEASGAVGSGSDGTRSGSAFFKENRCNRSFEGVLSAAGVAAEAPEGAPLGKIGLRAVARDRPGSLLRPAFRK